MGDLGRRWMEMDKQDKTGRADVQCATQAALSGALYPPSSPRYMIRLHQHQKSKESSSSFGIIHLGKWSSQHYFLNDWMIERGDQIHQMNGDQRGTLLQLVPCRRRPPARTAQHQVFVHLPITIDLYAMGVMACILKLQPITLRSRRRYRIAAKYRVTEKGGRELLKEGKATLGSGFIPDVYVQCVRMGVGGRDDS